MDMTLKSNHLPVITNVVGHDGEITGTAHIDSNNNLFISNMEQKFNGVTLAKMKTVWYRVERDGQSFSIHKQSHSGVVFDIANRVRQLTNGVDKDTIDQLMKGMQKFSSYEKTDREVWKENKSYQRMMVLAGISQRGVDAVKKFVTNAKNAAQNFLSGLTAKLTQFIGDVGVIFTDPSNLNKLKDGREHAFVIKDGKIEIK
jgi:hypothetical protein